MNSMLSVRKIVSVCVFGLLATGCASVNVSVPGMGADKASSETATSERVALVSASRSLSDNPWTSATGGMFSVMFGSVTETARERAISTYLDGLPGSTADKVSLVLADADHALAKARHVAEAGRQAVASISPVDEDIATLEAAIGDVRECRIMYTRSLEQLAKMGAPVERDDIKIVRDAFTQTIKDIGYTADIVASRVRDTRDQAQLAGADTGSEGGQ